MGIAARLAGDQEGAAAGDESGEVLVLVAGVGEDGGDDLGQVCWRGWCGLVESEYTHGRPRRLRADCGIVSTNCNRVMSGRGSATMAVSPIAML